MKWFAPNYFDEFACIAGACRHSCCKGWEIDIDAETLAAYRQISGDFGELLNRNIEEDAENPHFRLTEDERCPFLNENGLCDLILNLGPGSLCQICTDHPRFRNFFSDREEIGLGMCCEAAARLILGRKEKVSLLLTDEDDDDEQLNDEEKDLLLIRDELIAIAQDRTRSTPERVRRMLECAQLPSEEPSLPRWAAFLLTLERLDEGWGTLLTALQAAGENPRLKNPSEWELPFEQFHVYLLYRQLPGAIADGDLAGRIACCALMWHTVRALCAIREEQLGKLTLEEMAEICRMYSSEIEYSDENIAAVLEELDS